VKRSIRNLLSITLIVLFTGAPMFAQNRGAARTSVNQSGNTNRNANTNRNTNANINSNKNVNANVNQNVNVNKNVNVNVHNDVNVHGGYYGGGCCYHPVATAAAITATAIVVGSIVHSLPPSCSVVIVNGLTYQHCGSSWYQPQFVGTSTTYVVVNPPR
jgi:hypothetical protein